MNEWAAVTLVALIGVAFFGWPIFAARRRAMEQKLLMEERAHERQAASRQRDAYLSSAARSLEDHIHSSRILIDSHRSYGIAGLEHAAVDGVYRKTLGLLSHWPQLRPLALDMGRRRASLARAGGQPTVYDEQAIQNDIEAHAKEQRAPRG